MPTPPDDFLDPYLTGELAPEHTAEVRAYLDANPGRRGVMLGILASARAEDVPGRPTVESAHDRLMGRIEELAPSQEKQKKQRAQIKHIQGAPRSHIAMWLVALFVIGAGVGTFAWREQAHVGMSRNAAHTIVASSTISQTVQLSDGSRVTLAPSAVLTTSAQYGENNRTVSLQGRGYFEVVAGKSVPFIVNAHGVAVRVLGTTFGIDANRSSSKVRLAVTSGKISISRDTHGSMGRAIAPITLSAGMLATITDSSVTTTTSNGDTDAQRWGTGLLVFHNSRAQDVLAALSSWYGYQFRLADPSIGEKRLTIGISTESAASALSIFRQSLNVDLTFAGDTILVRPRTGANHNRSRVHDRDSAAWTLSHEVGR